jgi:hypothetical protein
MKTAVGVIGAAFAASACCIGPVAFSLIGAGALGASAVKLAPYRPWLIGLTLLFVAAAFYGAYRPSAVDCRDDGTCTPPSKQAAKLLAWIAAAIAAVLIAFPYYIGYLM